MEINIENAFIIVVKLSLATFSAGIENLFKKIQTKSYRLTVNLLNRPLLSTLLLTVILMMILSILTISVIILAATFCIAVIIIIIEGFIFGMILVLAIVGALIAIGCVIVSQGLKC